MKTPDMTDTTTQAVERCAEYTCKDGGIFCNWIAHGDPQVRQLVKDHAALLAERDAAEARARESALDALAAYGQAADAHAAQLAAEAKLAELEAMLARAYEVGRDDAAGAAEKRYDQCERVVGPCQLRKCAIARFLRDLPVPSPADLAARLGVGK